MWISLVRIRSLRTKQLRGHVLWRRVNGALYTFFEFWVFLNEISFLFSIYGKILKFELRSLQYSTNPNRSLFDTNGFHIVGGWVWGTLCFSTEGWRHTVFHVALKFDFCSSSFEWNAKEELCRSFYEIQEFFARDMQEVQEVSDTAGYNYRYYFSTYHYCLLSGE